MLAASRAPNNLGTRIAKNTEKPGALLMRSIFKIHSITALAPTINRQSVDIFKADTAGPAPEPDTAAPFFQVAFSRDGTEQLLPV